MRTSLLERVAASIVRLHGREFAASYSHDILVTLGARAQRARQDGRFAYARFATRELVCLLWSAVIQQLRPEFDPALKGDGVRFSKAQTLREFRYAIRRLLHAPGFTVAAVLMLGFTIAANTTVFAFVSRILLAPLPFPSADRLVALDHAAPGAGMPGGMGMSIGVYREYGALPAIESIALYTEREGTLADEEGARRIGFLQATPSIGDLTGAQPQVGRWFDEQDGIAAAPAVAVLTDALWQRRFGGSTAVLGRTIRLDGVPYEIVGVLQPDWVFPTRDVQLVIPLPLPTTWTRAAGFNYDGIARLAPGVSIANARVAQNTVLRDLANRYPGDTEIGAAIDAGLSSVAQPLKDSTVGGVDTILWPLFGASLVVFVMACANLANLFLVRHESKGHEVALLRALGASPYDIAVRILYEAVVIAMAGCLFGFWFAHAAFPVVVQQLPEGVPRAHELRIDTAAAMFTAVISLAAAFTLPLMPILREWLRQPVSVAGYRSGASRSQLRARHTLLVVQVAFSVVLLAAAGLLARSFGNLLRVDPGFDADSHLVFDVNLPRSEYRSRDDGASFHSVLLERLEALPGVNAAGLTSTLPLAGVGLGDPLDVRGRLAVAVDAAPVVRFRRVSTGYFATMGIPLRAGRWFDTADHDGRTDSVLVDDALARLYFGDADPVGQQIRPLEGDPIDRWLTIVGVVGNTATEALSEAQPIGKMYVPLRGSMWADVPAPHDVTYVLRVNGNPVHFVEAARKTVAELNPRVALARPERLADLVARARALHAATAILIAIAAVIAISVGTVGVYAAVSYAVKERQKEIGVRVALGAQPGQVTATIVLRGLKVIAAGVVVGIAISLFVATVLRSALFGIAPTDWATHVGGATLVSVVALAACWWPARRAARIDPTCALRAESQP